MAHAASPRLVLLVDVPGWAYDNIARQITPGLAADYEISRLYVKDHPDLATLLCALADIPPPAILHVFWRPLLFDLLDAQVLARAERQAGWEEGGALKRLARFTITTSVYDHLGLDPDGAARQARVLAALDGYATSSPILDAIYRKIERMPAPSAMLPDGVDTAFYRPVNLARFDLEPEVFRIGWVGNSQWGFLEGMPDAKGLNTIIKPAFAMLAAQGLPVELVLVDRAVAWQPREAVAEFYHGLDALLCASLVEGTPNPVLEAMASGVPIISTDVGVVRMCLGEAQAAFIVERTPQAFAEAIKRLVTTPGLRRALSAENLSRISAHDWAARRAEWGLFFANALQTVEMRGPEKRLAALQSASADLRPTWKMRVRSALRQSPKAYQFASKILHILTRALAYFRLKLRPPA